MVAGDLADYALVRGAVDGNDAVLSCIGLRVSGMAPWKSPLDVESFVKLNENVTKAVKECGVKRAMVLSSGAVGSNRHKVSTALKLAVDMTVLAKVYVYLEQMEQMYEQVPGLDLCLVHPPLLTDEPLPTGKAHIVPGLYSLKGHISRIDLVTWMVSELEKPGPFQERRPFVST